MKKRHLLNKLIISTAFFLVSFSQMPFAQGILTLQDAVQEAVKNNYNIVLTRDQEYIDKNNVIPGNAGMLPQVILNGGVSVGSATTDQKYSTGSEIKRNSVISSAYNYGANLNWTLFDGFKMFATYDKLKEIEQAGELTYESQVEHTVQGVITGYYGLVSQKQLLIFWDTAVSLSEKQLQIAERKFNVGAGSKVDWIEAKVALNSDLSSRFSQENQYDDARIKFNQLLARDVRMKFDVPDSIPAEEISDYESLHSKFIQHNPDIQIANKNVIISDYALKELSAQRLPKLNLTAGYNFNQTNTQVGLVLNNQSLGPSAGLSLTWNIFNGFVLNAQIKNQQIFIHQMQVDLAMTQTQGEADFNTAYTDYVNSKRLVQMTRDNYNLAHENVTIALLSFNLGSINALQMKDVQKTFEQTASDLTTARYNLLQAKTQLDRLCGLLPGTQ